MTFMIIDAFAGSVQQFMKFAECVLVFFSFFRYDYVRVNKLKKQKKENTHDQL